MFAFVVDYLAQKTLRKVWWRSDSFWTRSVIFSSPLIFVPYFIDRLALHRSQYWDREQIGAMTEMRLSDLFLHATKVPFWKKVFERSGAQSRNALECLRTLPITSRTDFKSMNEEEYCAQDFFQNSLRDSTSGSTGTPFSFLLDRGSLLMSWSIRDRQFRIASGGIRYPIIIFRADIRLTQRFYKPLFVYLRGYNDIPESFDVLKSYIEKVSPHGVALYMFPSTAVALAKYVEKKNDSLPIKALVAGGESMPESDRSYIEQTLNTNFSLAYGTQESSCIAFECEQRRLHINEEDILVEIVDENGHVLPDEQEGRVTITHLGYRVMPLIRYQNGDLGTISEEKCSCGRTLRTITVIGRIPTLIVQKGGYSIPLAELTSVFNASDSIITTFQIIHKSPDEFLIRIVPGPSYGDFGEDVRDSIIRKLHPDTTIVFETVPKIESSPNGKAKYYIREYSE